MVPTASIVTITFSLLVALLLPVAVLLFYALKNRGSKIFSAWFLGAAGFFVTQMLIRVPILAVLQTKRWFMEFAGNTPFLYAFSLAFTAGLFELAGRYVVARSMKKGGLNYRRSLAAGLGHGGIEAMILVGMSYITNLVYVIMINTGDFESLVDLVAASGLDVSQFLLLKDTLVNTHPGLYLLGGFERILAMTCHVGMSMVVCYFVREGKALRGCLISLIIHTLIDLTAGISLLIGNGLTQAQAYVIIYSILSLAAILSILIIRKIHRQWAEKEEK